MGSEEKVMQYFVQWKCDPHHCCVMSCLIILVGVVGLGGFCHYFGLGGRTGFFPMYANRHLWYNMVNIIHVE